MLLKERLREMVVWRYQNTDLYRRLGIQPAAGVLLYPIMFCMISI